MKKLSLLVLIFLAGCGNHSTPFYNATVLCVDGTTKVERYSIIKYQGTGAWSFCVIEKPLLRSFKEQKSFLAANRYIPVIKRKKNQKPFPRTKKQLQFLHETLSMVALHCFLEKM